MWTARFDSATRRSADIDNVDDILGGHEARYRRQWTGVYGRIELKALDENQWHIMHRGYAHDSFFMEEQSSELSVAKPGGVLQHGVEDRVKVAGRTGDNLQHLRCRRLLLERFRQIVCALAQLLQKARVLDGD